MQYRITNKKVLQIAEMVNRTAKMSEGCTEDRIKFIRHIRKGYDNDCRTAMRWAPKERRRRGRLRNTWRRTGQKKRATADSLVLRPLGSKQLGEGV